MRCFRYLPLTFGQELDLRANAIFVDDCQLSRVLECVEKPDGHSRIAPHPSQPMDDLSLLDDAQLALDDAQLAIVDVLLELGKEAFHACDRSRGLWEPT